MGKLSNNLRTGRDFQNMTETPEAIKENIDQSVYKETFLSRHNKKSNIKSNIDMKKHLYFISQSWINYMRS